MVSEVTTSIMAAPSISKLVVCYKYVESMPIVRKVVPSFLSSIIEKWEEYRKLRLELHVSPFYEYGDSLVWQPVLDFDGEDGKKELLAFYREQLKDDRKMSWFAELTGEGAHLCSRVGYYGIEPNDISKLRSNIKSLFQRYTSLDVTSSIRHLPIRRVPSASKGHEWLMFPVRPHQIMYVDPKKDFRYDLKRFKNVLYYYTLPITLKHIRELPWEVI